MYEQITGEKFVRGEIPIQRRIERKVRAYGIQIGSSTRRTERHRALSKVTESPWMAPTYLAHAAAGARPHGSTRDQRVLSPF